MRPVRTILGFLTARERVIYAALVATRALTGLLDVLGIALIALITSSAASAVDDASEPPSIAGIQLPSIEGAGLLWLVVFVLVVFVLKAAIAILLIRGQARFVAAVENRNAARIAEYLLGGSLANAKRYSKADFQYAVTNSAVFAFTGVLNNVAALITEGFLLLVIAATFVLVDPLAAVFTLVYFGLIVAAIQLLIARGLKRAGREAVAGTVDTMNELSDTIDTFREIAVLHKQRTFIDRVSASRSRIARSGASLTFLGGMPRYIVETSLILGVVLLVAQQFLTNSLAAGLVTIGVFLAGGVRMMASLLPLQSALSNLRQNAEQAGPAIGLLNELHDAAQRRSSSDSDSDGTRPHPPANENGLAVELRDVTFRYPGAAVDAVRDITLSVQPGAYVAVIGPSGAGKTTLVDLILGLADPDAGQVTIGGLPPTVVREIAPGRIAYVPQRPGLVSGTIAENIALGVHPADVDRARLDEVVDSAYLRDFVDGLPEGIHASVGVQADSLSGGQIQRIGVARALYSRPSLLVLDEATSGLDAGSEAFIAATLRQLHGHVTVVVIAHRLSTVQHADSVFVLEDGQITASGDFKSVQREAPMVAEYVKLMSFDTDETPAGGAV